MTLRFLLGRSGTGKTSFMLDEIRSTLAHHPEGNPIIYLVPDQMTFLSEYKLIKTPGLEGMIRAQVFSFSRLAWRVLQETGGMSRIHLDSVGVNMLIRKIMEEKQEELKVFRRSADKQGFVTQMEQMLVEFKRCCIQPEQLQSFLEQSAATSGVIQDKLHDLELIYQSFEEKLMGKYLQSEDYFTLLIEKLADSSYIANAQIYVDGFYSLTQQELLILEEMMKRGCSVTVALTLDRPYSSLPPDPLELFRQTGTTYYEIYQTALRLGVPIEEDKVFTEVGRFSENPALKHLEQHFAVRPVRPYESPANVIVSQAVNRRAEVEGVARTIVKLVRDEEYRFRDIAVLMRNGEAYRDIIQTVFRDYEIPLFIDSKRKMLHHPLIELIRSTLDILTSNWRYEPVFQAIKTELLFPLEKNSDLMREQVDRLENYVLSRGIKGEKWTSKERWTYRRFRGLELEERSQTDKERQIEEELNELKQWFTAPILMLSRRINRAETAKELSEALYLYLEDIRAAEQLEKLRQAAEEAGDLVAAREHEQAWNAVIDLLDQFVELLNEEQMSLKAFALIIEAGLDSLNFSLVPQAMDQVIIANLDLSRLDDVKAAFIIGLNDGVLPGKAPAEGIFSDQDRETLLANGLEVAPSSKIRLLDEEFIAYKAFSTPSHLLYVSYPLADEEGKALLPSSYIKRISDVIPHIHANLYSNDPFDGSPTEQADFIVNMEVALSHLTSQLQLKKRNYPMHPLWWDVYNALMDDEYMKNETSRVLSSIFYENQAKKLSSETTKQLYGESIMTSVSRMEMFNSCPFSHFAAHGLKLRERQVFRLDAPDIGEMFHGALKIISDYLYEHAISWAALTKDQCLTLARKAVETLAPKLQNQILLSSNRHHYLKRKLEQVIGRASIVLSEQAKLSGFAPIGLELGFGKNETLPPLSFSLQNGTQMELIGRIDRVDKAEESNGIFLRVLDYKSSEKDLSLTEVYYGLALQMLTYLDIVVTHSRSLIGTEALPAGVLYFHMHNPVIKSKGMLSLDQIEEEMFKSFKMKGLILGDTNVIQLMDQSLEVGASSKSHIIPASLKKDGTVSAASKIASRDEFSLLQKHVRHIYENAGNKMVNGDVGIAPYKLKDRTPCKYCSFKTVCQFDSSLEDNEYRTLTDKKQKDVLALLREGVEV
ncbi:helicase-exonuclease AddAB subunit AddB [Peribacillus asahii]|uniref:helicase-exonuclease AddAB subunit AddB n=1 Tax=Peribacillus asahii TaxID=228899 RepID=UPI00382B1C57